MAIEVPTSEAEDRTEAEERVSPLELFFDLVFVFAITQVTAFIAADPTWGGLARGLAILAVVWMAWVAYSWLTNTLDTDDSRTRVAMFVAMGAMFVASLSIPEAFDKYALLFALAYFVVRAAHVMLYVSGFDQTDVQHAVRRLATPTVVATLLLVAASALDGAAQGAVWLVAIAIDYGGPIVGGVKGWKLHPGHFAERYGLIIILALGESIVATGLGAEGIELDFEVVLAALLAIAIAAALWWAYFDVVAIVAERRLRTATGAERAAIARDSYSYIHLGMIAGIVLLALGAKKTIEGVGEPLKIVPAVALCGGVALYLLAHIAFGWRNIHSLNWRRLLAAGACLALIPLATSLDALFAEAALSGVLALLILYEVVRYREVRERVHSAEDSTVGPED